MVVRNTDESTEPSPSFHRFFERYLQQEDKSSKEREQFGPSINKSGTYRFHTNRVSEIVTFEEALSILDEYAGQYSEDGIPSKFTSVIEIYNN